MDVKKSLSSKIDETIDHFLLFVVRYFRTIFAILRSPLSPQHILNSSYSSIPEYVRPLSFLAIGAFAFSLLISVYPMGMSGMVDLIWFADEIKEEIRKNWKQAISITSLVTVGMPVIFAITGIASFSGLFFFKDIGVRKKWFDANCYAFGFQSIMFLVVLSLDSITYAFIAIFRFLETLPVNEDNLSNVLIIILMVFIIISYVWPLLFISSSFVKLKQFGSFTYMRKHWFTGALYFFLVFYFYSGAASVLPYLENKFFEKPKAEISISKAEFTNYDRSKDELIFEVEFLIDNILSKDLIIDIKDSEFKFVFEESATQILPLQFFETEGISVLYPVVSSEFVRVEKNSFDRLALRLPLENVKGLYCNVINMEKESNIADGDDVEDSHFAFAFSANVISSEIELETSQFVDIDKIYEMISGAQEERLNICVDDVK